MHMPHQSQQSHPATSWVTPKVQLGIIIIFGIGVVSCFIMLIGAVVAAAMILNLAMQTLCDLAANIHQLYGSSDSFTRLLIIGIVVYIVARLGQRAYQSFTSKYGGGIA